MEDRTDIERLARIETLVEEIYKTVGTFQAVPTTLATIQGILDNHELRLNCLEQAKTSKSQTWYAALIAAFLSFIGNWFMNINRGG